MQGLPFGNIKLESICSYAKFNRFVKVSDVSDLMRIFDPQC
jgi:hypothetical protein